MQINRGFTLIELMVTIAVLAIVIVIAAPSFTSVLQSNRTTALHHEILGALQLARSEAVKRRTEVIVCRSDDREDCANGADWTVGWIVKDVTSDDVVKVWDSVTGMALTGPITGAVFRSNGMANAVTNFTTTTSSCTSGAKYTIEISRSGNATAAKTGCP
ncbi:GspH/FimT family pseudopilin [Pseudomonas stutzeri]|uniref:GspH/FimT family pseudopilin n=1 Tax=Stutzerimonas stutzeri TaxID=316 RepID=UPI00210D7CFA|nr:GspH/FimT family pseudopilin [Stutzerimonas stutzeri]MCQ4309776.1 GspH/FimT family pseudopilin [Stutzerimonas stutzeri]